MSNRKSLKSDEDYIQLRSLEEAKAERAKERERRANSYGSLDRAFKKSIDKIEWMRQHCNCGAFKAGGMHDSTCPCVGRD